MLPFAHWWWKPTKCGTGIATYSHLQSHTATYSHMQSQIHTTTDTHCVCRNVWGVDVDGTTLVWLRGETLAWWATLTTHPEAERKRLRVSICQVFCVCAVYVCVCCLCVCVCLAVSSSPQLLCGKTLPRKSCAALPGVVSVGGLPAQATPTHRRIPGWARLGLWGRHIPQW